MKVSDEQLAVLIQGLQEYKDQGVVDPWILDDGTKIEPLDVLRELQDARGREEVNADDWIAELLERNKSRFTDPVEDREVLGHEVGVLLDKIKRGDVRLK